MNYPIIMNDVLPLSEFFCLRDEFEHKGWTLNNYSYKLKKMNVEITDTPNGTKWYKTN